MCFFSFFRRFDVDAMDLDDYSKRGYYYIHIIIFVSLLSLFPSFQRSCSRSIAQIRRRNWKIFRLLKVCEKTLRKLLRKFFLVVFAKRFVLRDVLLLYVKMGMCFQGDYDWYVLLDRINTIWDCFYRNTDAFKIYFTYKYSKWGSRYIYIAL